MTALEILLILIGFSCICVSFFVARKKEKERRNPEMESATAASLWTEKEEQMIRERVTELLDEYQMELVDSAEDRMNRLCNEKIMAMDEFSRPLMEKIENNHQEVVFMYNLLNEKEKEVKRLLTDSVPKQAEPKEVKTTPVTGVEKAAQKKAVAPMPKRKTVSAESSQPKVAVRGDVNLQIQKMYKEGKSVLEISKALDMGQGEVKLVIALYGGKAR